MTANKSKLKTLIVLGTRPEAIKLAPVIREMRKRPWALPIVCVTGQHREMADQMLSVFAITPDINLDVMTRSQRLSSAAAKILIGMQKTLRQVAPHLVVVQGDTTTTFAASLAAFYEGVPVAHVEAGLRTQNRLEPFPEEINRRLADSLAELLFPATEENRRNLLKEGIEPDRIFVVGNTVVDALKHVIRYNRKKHFPELPRLSGRMIITVTAHRRESFGQPLENICKALLTVLEIDDRIEIVYPVHPNPNVTGPARKYLSRNERIHLLPPLDYLSFIELLRRSELILTDSGGIQEEAPTLKKPVLLMRNLTERPEGIHAGFVKIVGTDAKDIVAAARQVLQNPTLQSHLQSIPNPYGDGRSAQRIVSIIGQHQRQLLSRRPFILS
ncbi:MAG: UDP-N-acetylglucosamine 2-epimerase (non-hydrolyzing) [Candidatus Abyssobacteria bacterium SURF_5]|uniref:UDP-N-acetylglucosamine 2-epimerase (non-hydrolyzing) n=1 Tax=Abyssobacteria bacterium (strain SURF_5) TaxID=2093360 RepID=A0A3A4P4B6_ABYX5|nr:MAG: UDP-N-acetylglucosamine 2-epimerase (non-hydrolyzing) [Candidatus Abyssubacteria bacterium SURF_5]